MILITGTGRAGTTFLMRLIVRMGFDTGFKDIESNIFNHANAGLERDWNDNYLVVKSIQAMFDIEDVLDKKNVTHVIIPIRDIDSVVSSRIYQERTGKRLGKLVPGGLHGTDKEGYQKEILLGSFYKFVNVLVCRGVAFSFLPFPDFLECPQKVMEVFIRAGLPVIPDDFYRIFEEEVNHELVHF